eukprot:COSAG06_NODE_3707_length_4993_cov_331.834083_1_plen_531_part_00
MNGVSSIHTVSIDAKAVGGTLGRAEPVLQRACRSRSTPRASRQAAMSDGASAEPMAVSLSAGMDATRRAARHGANTGIAEAARQLIRSLRAPQRRVLADALAACVDIAVLLSECEQPKAKIRSEQSTKAPRPARPSSSKASQSSSGKPAAVPPETPGPPPTSSLPVGRRLEYRFEVAGSPGWYAGHLLRDVGDRWADVQFDDGATMCVKLPLEDSTVWRWSLPDSLEPAPKRLAKRQRETATLQTSEYVGIHWDTKYSNWKAQISHDGKKQYLGNFDDEHEAARAFDTAARRLRGEDAHGGRSGKYWNRLNFPTEEEVKRAVEKGALLTQEAKDAAAAAKKKRALKTSEYVGVSWNKNAGSWSAELQHDGTRHLLGSFDDEHEAARAVDTAARRLRGEDAHGGRSGVNWFRLNFPTEREVRRAVERGALLTAEDRAAAVAASEQQGPSKFVGVSWKKKERKWVAQLNHNGNAHRLGRFDDEQHAARTFDTTARRLRGDEAHGGTSGGRRCRLNFPTQVEAARAKARGMPN